MPARTKSRAPRRPPRRAARARRAPARRRAGRVLPLLLLLFLLGAAFLPPTRATTASVLTRLDATLRELRAVEAREWAVAGYAAAYGIPRELAASIERAAVEEGIEPELAFRVVRVESAFREDAVSPAGALGLTQLMPATADELRPGITRDEILERETNLRLGFRYLRILLRVYGSEEEALTAYNRGPGTVDRIRAVGGDPANGYADLVLGERGGSPVRRPAARP